MILFDMNLHMLGQNILRILFIIENNELLMNHFLILCEQISNFIDNKIELLYIRINYLENLIG